MYRDLILVLPLHLIIIMRTEMKEKQKFVIKETLYFLPFSKLMR